MRDDQLALVVCGFAPALQEDQIVPLFFRDRADFEEFHRFAENGSPGALKVHIKSVESAVAGQVLRLPRLRRRQLRLYGKGTCRRDKGEQSRFQD